MKQDVSILLINIGTWSLTLSDVNILLQIILAFVSICYVSYKLIKKNKRMKNILIILTSLIFVSCSMQKTLCKMPFQKLFVKDSIVNTIIIKNNIDSIYLPQDNGTFEAWLRCDSLGNVYLNKINELQGKNIKINTIYKDNYIKINCNNDSLLFLIASKDSIINNKDISISIKTIEKEIKYVPFYYYIIFGICLISCFFAGFKIQQVFE